MEIVGRLRPGLSKDNARAQLGAWDSNRSVGIPDRRATNLDLLPRRGTVPQPLEAIAVFAPLFVAFGLILMIGCANVANLLLAREWRGSGRSASDSRLAHRGGALSAS